MSVHVIISYLYYIKQIQVYIFSQGMFKTIILLQYISSFFNEV